LLNILKSRFVYCLSVVGLTGKRSVAVKSRLDIRNRPRIPIPDEDPYSVAGSGSSGSSSGAGKSAGVGHLLHQQLLQQKQQKLDKPPKLPPRDVAGYPHDIPKVGAASFASRSRRFKNCLYILIAIVSARALITHALAFIMHVFIYYVGFLFYYTHTHIYTGVPLE
jgi:hypothetical protein